MPFNQPDEPFSDDLQTNVNNFIAWSYYDNYQHGKYINENKSGYGPIKVFNATVEIGVPPELAKDLPEDTIAEWMGYEFKGDVSERRFNFLIELTKRFKNVEVNVVFEHHSPENKLWYEIRNGNIVTKRKEGDVETHENDI